MYLHIGNRKNIRKKQLIGIFDTDNATVSEITRSFLKKKEKEGRVSSAVNEIPKSFVLYNGLSSKSYSRASERIKRRRDPIISDGEKKGEGKCDGGASSARTSFVCFSQLSSSSLSGRLDGKE